MGVLEKMRGFLKRGGDEGERTQEAENLDAETEEAVHLYRCSACETTYVNPTMAMCPEYGGPLEDTPNESDRGMT